MVHILSLHWKLRWLKFKLMLGYLPKKGICEEVRGSPELVRLFPGWKKFSGCQGFPVPCPWTADLLPKTAAITTYYACKGTNHMWNKYSAYGKLRRELLDYLIEQTK